METGSEPGRLPDEIRMDLTPKRRDAQLLVIELADETLVYDQRTHHAHCLNQTTAAVWRQCDGARSVPAIAAALEQEQGVPAGSGAVWLALDELREAELLEVKPANAGVTLTRRTLLRTVAAAGVAAAALPTIKSITAPTAAAAASGSNVGQTCMQGGQCTSAFCCTTIVAGTVCTQATFDKCVPVCATAPCLYNADCVSNHCTPQHTCAPIPVLGGPGAACPCGGGDCLSGFCCSGTSGRCPTGAGVCGTNCAPGPCAQNSDCANGNCVGGVCTRHTSFGGPCGCDGDCYPAATATCVSGTCQTPA